MLDKSRGLTVDCVTYDLEDSVSMNMKAEARQNLRAILALPRSAGIKEQAVRINAVDSGLAEDDLAELVGIHLLATPIPNPYSKAPQCKSPHLDTIVVPKVNSASDLNWITDYLAHHLPSRNRTSGHEPQPLKLLALIESAQALTNLSSICTATPLLSGLVFAAEDFALDISLTRTPPLTEFLYARSAIVTAARAHGLPSAIDLVCTSFKGDEGREAMERECRGGKGLGFNGKQCVHPSQVEIAQRAFAPGPEEVEWAVRVLVAGGKAGGRGAWGLDGRMVDVPVVRKAGATVDRAVACGFDVEMLRGKWKDQEPE